MAASLVGAEGESVAKQTQEAVSRRHVHMKRPATGNTASLFAPLRIIPRIPVLLADSAESAEQSWKAEDTSVRRRL